MGSNGGRRGGLAPDRYLSREQERQLMRYVKERADLARSRGRTRAVIDEFIIHLMLKSGLRANEVISLDMRDLPLKHGKPALWVRHGKGEVERVVHIGPKLARAIRRFCRVHRRGAGRDDPLLINERGVRYGYMSLYRKVRRLGAAAGIGNLTPHMLRHTYATRLYGTDHDLRFVQDQLGHASPRTTAIYAKTDPKAAKAMLEAMERDDA